MALERIKYVFGHKMERTKTKLNSIYGGTSAPVKIMFAIVTKRINFFKNFLFSIESSVELILVY